MTRMGEKIAGLLAPVSFRGIHKVVIGLQLLTYILQAKETPFVAKMTLTSPQVLIQEPWRILTWFFIPYPGTSPIWVILYFLVFYSFGSVVEELMGPARNLAFYLSSWLLATIFCLSSGEFLLFNYYPSVFVFLVYAGLAAGSSIALFGILPIPTRIMGAVTWIFFFLSLSQIGVMAGLGFLTAYLLLFGLPFNEIRASPSTPAQIALKKKATPAFHLCSQCGATEKTAPDADFRICTKCDQELCTLHLENHTKSCLGSG